MIASKKGAQPGINIFIGIIYFLIISYATYLTWPIINGIIQATQGVIRIAAITGSLVFAITLIVIIPALMLMETSAQTGGED